MSDVTCGLCGQPVTMRKERWQDRMSDPTLDGRWVHTRCAAPRSPEEQLLQDIFGTGPYSNLRGVRREALTREAAKVGHETTVERDERKCRRWVCTCGARSAWVSYAFDQLRDSSNEHKRSAIFLGSFPEER